MNGTEDVKETAKVIKSTTKWDFRVIVELFLGYHQYVYPDGNPDLCDLNSFLTQTAIVLMDRHQFLPSHKPAKEWRLMDSIQKTSIRDVGFTEAVDFGDCDEPEEDNDSDMQSNVGRLSHSSARPSPPCSSSGGGSHLRGKAPPPSWSGAAMKGSANTKPTSKLLRKEANQTAQRSGSANHREPPRESQERHSHTSQMHSPWSLGALGQSSGRLQSPSWSGGGGGCKHTLHVYFFYSCLYLAIDYYEYVQWVLCSWTQLHQKKTSTAKAVAAV